MRKYHEIGISDNTDWPVIGPKRNFPGICTVGRIWRSVQETDFEVLIGNIFRDGDATTITINFTLVLSNYGKAVADIEIISIKQQELPLYSLSRPSMGDYLQRLVGQRANYSGVMNFHYAGFFWEPNKKQMAILGSDLI